MTRTDVMASSRPVTTGAHPTGRRSGALRRGLIALSALLVLAFALAAPGVAGAESTTGYNNTPTTPTTPSTTPTTTTPVTPGTTTPTTGTSPSKEEKTTPTSKEEPTKSTATTPVTSTSPTATTSAEKATTLPFTGFDLRWSVAIGLVLVLAGFSIFAAQRRQHRGRSR